MGKSNIPVMIFRCMWCGWRGTLEEMDMDETDAPAYCPECGHGDLIYERRSQKKHVLLGMDDHRHPDRVLYDVQKG